MVGMKLPRKLWGGLGNSMFQHAYIQAQVDRGEIPDIYVQDEKYFAGSEDKIKATYGQGIVKSDYVSLHIRRGDYVGNSFYVDLTQTDYYDRAIAMFPNEKFLVFCADRQHGSDDDSDRAWCEKWLTEKGVSFYMYNGDDAIDDMNAMAGCKAHIIANSSFSWWAAYIGSGRVIAPLGWYTDGVERTKLPSHWERI